MTLEQITRMKDLAYGIGGGIACLVIAYPYAFTTPKEGNPGPEIGLPFTAAGLALFVTAGVRSYKVRKSGTPDLRASIGLFVAGLIALAASYLVDHTMLGERLPALLLDVGLVLVAAISFIVAGWAAPQVARRRCSARS
jgi:hypothetical protein